MYKLVKSNGKESYHEELNDALWNSDLGSKIYLNNRLVRNIF